MAGEYQSSGAVLSALALVGLALAGSMFYVIVFPAKPPVIPGIPVVIPSNVSVDSTLNFNPFNITIHAGQAIQWINRDSVPHTSTATSVPTGASRWDSGEIDSGNTFTQAFTVLGTYQYHCTFHPLWMRGSVTVIP